MRADSSGIGSLSGGIGSRFGARSARLRKSRLRSSALEGLEPRVLLAVLPATAVSNANQKIIEPGFFGDHQNDYSPSIAVDPNNPQYMAAAWTINDPDFAPGPTTLNEAAVSTNGGSTWTQIEVGPQEIDPSSGTSPAPFANVTAAAVAFDHSDNLYILRGEYGGSTGELFLTKYHVSGGTFTPVHLAGEGTGFFNSGPYNDPVYQWTSGTTVNTPSLAVDSGVGSFSDQGKGQNDPYAGNIYVSWSAVTTAPKFLNPGITTLTNVYVAASSDGGNTFSSPVLAAGNSLGGNSQNGVPRSDFGAGPQLAVAQGTIQGDPSRTVAPGTVAVVWDSVNQGTNLGPDDTDALVSGRLTGDVTQVVNTADITAQNRIVPIAPAVAGVAPAPNTPSTTTLHFNVSLPANFQSLSNLTATLGIIDPTNSDLNIVLVPPSGSGLPPVTLVDNGTNAAGQAIVPPQGIAGGNIGINTNGVDFGTIFDDNAPLNITDGNAAAPFIGRFGPEGLQDTGIGLDNPAYTSASASKLSGQWTVVITNYGTSNAGSVQFASLNFTSGLVAGTTTTFAHTSVRGTETGTGFPTGSAADPNGIGPDPSLAFDNTLGAYSPYQGRLYATFVDKAITGSPGPLENQLDNTDIGLAYSDNAGLTWTEVVGEGQAFGSFFTYSKINDDDGQNDGFSSAAPDSTNPVGSNFATVPGSSVADGVVGRPQFLPSIAVDDATGALVMSWYDVRNDPARSRAAVYMTTSIDGGGSFSPDVLASEAQTAVNAINPSQTVVLGPVPEAGSGGFSASFGNRTGLAVYDGKAYPAWIGNENGATINGNRFSFQVQTSVATFDTGPEVTSSTQGPVSGNPAADGTPQASSFQVVFNRPIPAGNFTAANVAISYHDTTAGDPAVPITPSNVVPQNVDDMGMTTTFLVQFPPSERVGTYSYTISNVKDGIKAVTAAGISAGNPMTAPYSVGLAPGSLPLIVSGPIVDGSDAQNATNNLAVNSKVSYVDIDFDRNMAGPGMPGALTPAGVLSVVGPAGSVLQPQAFASAQVGQKVPDGTGTPLVSQVIVPNDDGTFPIANLAVVLNLSSTRDGDLAMYLVGPGGTTIRLAAAVGGNGAGFVGTVFSDLASQSITQGAAPFSGLYRPVDPLATYTGKQLQGAWALVVFDNTKNGSTSVLNSWSLVATPSATVEPNPTPGANPDPAHPRSYRVGFPEQTLSGTYTVTIAPTVTDENGNALDTNQNAGVDVLNGTVSNTSVAVPVTYTSTNVPQALTSGTVATSTITVPDNFRAQAQPGTSSISVVLNITHPSDPDLQVVLVPPPTAVDSQGHPIAPIVLVAQGTGVSSGSEANFSNTVFNESASALVDTSFAPFFGSFKPHSPLDVLTQNGGVLVGGTWTLQITDTSTSNTPASGALTSWSLIFGKGTPSSGLGEPVADQATVGFQIFTLNPNNPQSQTTWTPVGPSPVTPLANTVPANPVASGPVSAIAFDPSDPSDNTAYVAASSGGIWKTTDFLTTNPAGPTYVPLTDFGPTFATDIGSISVVARNNDPRQSIIIAGTGNANTVYGDTANNSYGGPAGQGVGFIISTDGGATWNLLDSTNNNLPFAQRDHLFAQDGGTATAKVVADPHLLLNGQAIIYAAMVGPNGGLWRSVDTGQTWQKLSTAAEGSATDVLLDTSSATVDALTNPTGNVNTIYAAFPGSGVYISPNRGTVLNLLDSLPNVPQIVDSYLTNRPALINDNVVSPTGVVGGRIVLAAPTPVPGATLANTLYSGWLYAAVSDPDGAFEGVYLTKDFGQTWTKLQLPNLPYSLVPAVVDPTNDGSPNMDPTTGNFTERSAYNLSLTVDPANPNIVYLGGTQNSRDQSALIRIDATTVYDTHAVAPYDSSETNGATLYSTVGRATIDNPPFFTYSVNDFPDDPLETFDYPVYINLVYNPNTPEAANSVYGAFAIHAVTNSGIGVKWTPDNAVLSGANNLHEALSFTDPLTHQTRLVFATDDGVYSNVITPGGAVVSNVGTAVVPSGSRNGDLQIAEDYSGAVQPTTAGLSAQVTSLVYGNTQATGMTATGLGVVGTGKTGGTSQLSNVGNGATELDGTGVATDQQGQGTVYRFMWPAYGPPAPDGTFTTADNSGLANFFQVSTSGDGSFVGRTNGLIQGNRAQQWPTENQTYADGTIQFGTFAVNPIDGDQVIIGDATGQIFSTINQGVTWLSIGQPDPGDYADALAYGAPDPNGPAGLGNLNNFLYAGTVDGKLYVTQTGGGSVNGGNAWTDISNGLDGSPVVSIVPDPTRGNHAAYAVTQKGVYFIADSITDSSWTNITGNLFGITTPAFGNAAAAQPLLQYLTTLQVDWRYTIPNTAGTGIPSNTGTGTFNPVLFVAGQGGVFQSINNGAAWALFPSAPGATPTADGASANGGYLPNARVSSLSLAVGAINSTTGYAVSSAGSPDLLVASTFGRGQFAIVAGPDVFANTVALDPTLPAPAGSANGTDPTTGLPLASTSQPYITGISATTADGNRVRITLYDLSNPSSPRIIGGYDPSNPATDIASNWTDESGRFHVQINSGVFNSGGVKTVGVQATDLSGTVGNMDTFQFVISGAVSHPNQPPTTPTLTMNPADDTSGGLFYTSDASPHLIGTTDPGVAVQLYLSNGTNPILASPFGPAVTANSLGAFTVQPSAPLASGVYVVQAVATNAYGHSQSAPFTFHIETSGPQSVPTLHLDPLDDTGVVGDGFTAARSPHFVGTTDPNSVVSLYRVVGGVLQPGALATTTADASGNYSLQLSYRLYDGLIASANGSTSVEVGVTDQAGNAGKFSNPLPALTIVSVTGDYAGVTPSTTTTPAVAKTTPALFRRAPGGTAGWLIQGVSPAAGIAFGSSTTSIPFAGDFDGDGTADLAVYQPSSGSWTILRSSYGLETFTLGGPGTVPAVGVFASDGLTDPAAYNPATGQWTILTANSGVQTVTFNNQVFTPQAGDLPVPGNYTNNPDGVDQLAIYRPSTGTFYIKVGTNPDGTDIINYYTLTTGAPGDVPVPGNYNDAVGVRQTDPAVYNPSTGVWKVLDLVSNQAQTYQFQPGDVPAPGDYTGSGRTQAVVYRPGASAFVSASGSVLATLGQPGDIPVTAPLVYRDLVGNTLNPSLVLDPGSDTGIAGDDITSTRRPVVDGRTSPNTVIDLLALGGGVVGQGASDALGDYQIQVSSGADLPDGTYTFLAIAHGTEAHPAILGPALTVKLVTTPGDYLGAGATQVALFRRTGPTTAQWFVDGDPAINGLTFGAGALDVPVSGDFDGSGKTSLAVFRPATGQWFVATAGGGYTGVLWTVFGQAGDIPLPGNFFGTGASVPAVYRPSDGGFYIEGFNGGKPIVVVPPQPGDIPVVADFDNVGRDEVAIYRPSASGSTWFILGPNGVRTVQYGGPGLIPVPGAYDATATNHAAEPALWSPSTGAFYILGSNGQSRTLQFAPGDIPIPGDYDGTGVTEAAVYRPGSPGVILVRGPNDRAPWVLGAFGGPTDVPVLAPYPYRFPPATPSYAKPKPTAISIPSPAAMALTPAVAATVIAPAAPQAQPASLDFGVTARALGSGTAQATSAAPASAFRPLTPPPAASPVSPTALTVLASRLRPRQNAADHAPTLTAGFLPKEHALAKVRANHHR